VRGGLRLLAHAAPGKQTSPPVPMPWPLQQLSPRLPPEYVIERIYFTNYEFCHGSSDAENGLDPSVLASEQIPA